MAAFGRLSAVPLSNAFIHLMDEACDDDAASFEMIVQQDLGRDDRRGWDLSAPTDDLQIGEVSLPELVGRRRLVLELIGCLHDDEGRAGDQVVCLEQPMPPTQSTSSGR